MRIIVTGVRVQSKGETVYVDVHYIDPKGFANGVTGYKVSTVKGSVEAAQALSKAVVENGFCVAEVEFSFETFGKQNYPCVDTARPLAGVTFQFTSKGLRYSDQK